MVSDTNNRASNLEWVNGRENVAAAVALGLWACGTRKRNAKLTPEIVMSMRKEYGAGAVSFDVLAARHGIDKSTARRAVRGRKWRHLPGAVSEAER